ncbi:hypothetical protein LY56_03531 [Roseinatronobacter thiooxidans]|uniref:Uncharacterized protein n=2 Tax=Roseinatronobacter thiooxidans TaxID=121821 RepID=A0A2W7Q5N4_9RHOB|nr:hypothetical protein LY56_03531 [Roseinatronobacter thiooxidans]
MIREGSDTADIVARTGNSIATVPTHLRNIYAKAQITVQVALVRHLNGRDHSYGRARTAQSAYMSYTFRPVSARTSKLVMSSCASRIQQQFLT